MTLQHLRPGVVAQPLWHGQVVAAFAQLSPALCGAIVAADEDAVVAALHGRSEAERRVCAPALMRAARAEPDRFVLGPGGELIAEPERHERHGVNRVWYSQLGALRLAMVGTCTLPELRPIGWGIGLIDAAHGSAVLLDRRPPWLAKYANWVLERDTRSWPLVRRLVVAGAIERPAAPLYLGGLVATGHTLTISGLAGDERGLAEGELLALLTADTGEHSLRAADNAGASWNALFQACVADGRLSRERVLDAILDGLAGDMIAYRAVWHTKLWKDLAPTRAERAQRTDRLRRLLGAAAEPVVAFAVRELQRVPGADVTPAELTPALSVPAKSTALAALRLLDRAPDTAVAAIALGHPSVDVQRAALDRLEAWGADAEVLHPRAEALLSPTTPEPDEDIPEPIRSALAFGGPVPTAPIPGEPVLGDPIEPIATLEELADVLGASLAAKWQAPVDERLLDGILRHCEDRSPFEAELAPYVERLREYASWDDRDYPGHVAAAWLTGVPPTPGRHPNAWEHRIVAAGERAARGQVGPLLALPTHAGGWIDPRVLVERLRDRAASHAEPAPGAPGPDAPSGEAATAGTDGPDAPGGEAATGRAAPGGGADAVPDDVELTAALFRLAPDGRAEALVAAQDLPGRAGALVRCALGGASVEGHDPATLAARTVREPPLDPIEVSVRFRGERCHAHIDPAALPWGALAFPARRDVACAAAFAETHAGLNDGSVDSDRAQAVLPTLVPAREPLRPLAIRLVTLALGAAPERVHLLAVDVLIAGIEDGRIDALPLDDVACMNPIRLADQLRVVADAGPLQRAVVREFLDASIHLIPARPGPLLVLFDELCAQTGTGPRHAREHLTTIKHKAANALLQRVGSPPAEEARLALAARVRRAQRWLAARR